MDYLVATDSVHTTAAACDYLEPRLDGPADTVTVCTVDAGQRDAGDAANVARARLAGRATVRTATPEATDRSVAAALFEAVESTAADVLLIGPRSGEPGAEADLGSTARTVLAGATVPVVVLPLDDLDRTGME